MQLIVPTCHLLLLLFSLFPLLFSNLQSSSIVCISSGGAGLRRCHAYSVYMANRKARIITSTCAQLGTLYYTVFRGTSLFGIVLHRIGCLFFYLGFNCLDLFKSCIKSKNRFSLLNMATQRQC